MKKDLLFGKEARERIIRGLETVAEAVCSTLGPNGQTVVIEKEFGVPIITKDGVTVAKSIELVDRFENLGASLIKEASAKTNDEVGDGTTTSTLLVREIVRVGSQHLERGVLPQDLKRVLDAELKEAKKILLKLAKEVTTDDEMRFVAEISATDKELGEKIFEAVKKVGRDGVVSVEESPIVGTFVEVTEGLEFDRGFMSPLFVTNKERGEVEMSDAYVLICDKKITGINELIPIIEKVAGAGKNEMIIVADEIVEEVLQGLVFNKVTGRFNATIVKSPGFGEGKSEHLEDLSSVIGGHVFSDKIGDKLEEATIEQLGVVKRVTVKKDKTVFVGGSGSKAVIAARIAALKHSLEIETSDFEKEKLRKRIAKLTNGVAVIKVGAATEAETVEIKHRIIDAVSATKAALEEGIVAGGGVALLNTSQLMKSENFLKDVLTAPIKTISENCGTKGDDILEATKTLRKGFGFDFSNGENKPINMFKAGIVDPLKVVRLALENAVSAAGSILTTNVAIVNYVPPEKQMDNRKETNL